MSLRFVEQSKLFFSFFVAIFWQSSQFLCLAVCPRPSSPHKLEAILPACPKNWLQTGNIIAQKSYKLKVQSRSKPYELQTEIIHILLWNSRQHCVHCLANHRQRYIFFKVSLPILTFLFEATCPSLHHKSEMIVFYCCLYCQTNKDQKCPPCSGNKMWKLKS